MSENSFTSNDVSLADISFKNKLKSHHIYFTIVNKVVDLIMKIPEYHKLKFEQETRLKIVQFQKRIQMD